MMNAASSLLCGTGEISFEADLVNELNFDQFLDRLEDSLFESTSTVSMCIYSNQPHVNANIYSMNIKF